MDVHVLHTARGADQYLLRTSEEAVAPAYGCEGGGLGPKREGRDDDITEND